MKAIVVGYGSMGRRRTRLLKKIEPDAEIICVDSNPDRQKQAVEDGHSAYADLREALDKERPEIGFVCTSPGHHDELILQLLDAGMHVFTELNLVNTGYDEIIQKSKDRDIKVFMSSTPLYNRMVQKIRELVGDKKKPLTYIYHVGQYLPDWHPWESYKDFFVGKKETNGVREIYAIQLPWLIQTFGKIKEVHAFGIQCTTLDIDYYDSITVSFRHENGTIGTFVADVTSRRATTHLEVIGEEVHILWDGHNSDLYVYDFDKKEMQPVVVYDTIEHVNEYADNILENPYEDEIRDFLDMIRNDSTPRYSIEQDKATLQVIDEIEGIR